MRALSCLLVLWLPAIALADTPSVPEAERLFQEGLALFDAGKFDDACEKFDQSIKKNPRALGTLMNLGRCNERRGKVATALRLYQEAYDRAAEAGATAARDTAQERITALAAQVPIVVLKRAGAPLPSEKLVVDDVVLDGSKTEISLDPGPHTFVLTAPGRLPFEKQLAVAASTRVTLELPVLEEPKPEVVVTRVGSTRATLGKVLVIAGGAAAVISGGLVLYAKRDYDKQFTGNNPHCTRDVTIEGLPACDSIGKDRTDRARAIVTSSSVLGALGVGAAAAGAILWWMTPRERSEIVPTASATSVGVTFVGRF